MDPRHAPLAGALLGASVLFAVGCATPPAARPATATARAPARAHEDLAAILAAVNLPRTVDGHSPPAWSADELSHPCGPVPLVVGTSSVHVGVERLGGLEVLRQPRRIMERVAAITRQRLTRCEAVVDAVAPPPDDRDLLCVGCGYDDERPPLVVLAHADLDSGRLAPLLGYCANAFNYPLRVVLRAPGKKCSLAYVDVRPRPGFLPAAARCERPRCPLGLTLEIHRTGVFFASRAGWVAGETCSRKGPTVCWRDGHPSHAALGALVALVREAKNQQPEEEAIQVLWQPGVRFETVAQVSSIALGLRENLDGSPVVTIPNVSWGVGAGGSVASMDAIR